MAETVGITKEQLQEILIKVIGAAKAMNPIEEEEYKKKLELKQRRDLMMIELGKIEEMREKAKRDGCTHCRWPAGGKQAGMSAPKGQGEWCTAGQIHGSNTIVLLCQRCGWTWIFKGSEAELDYAANAGLLGFPPPPEERCLQTA